MRNALAAAALVAEQSFTNNYERDALVHSLGRVGIVVLVAFVFGMIFKKPK